MSITQKVVHNTVGVPARGIKRIARAVTQPLRDHREKRAKRRG
jgi:hypothetical protein